jgi:hypothetical protein
MSDATSEWQCQLQYLNSTVYECISMADNLSAADVPSASKTQEVVTEALDRHTQRLRQALLRVATEFDVAPARRAESTAFDRGPPVRVADTRGHVLRFWAIAQPLSRTEYRTVCARIRPSRNAYCIRCITARARLSPRSMTHVPLSSKAIRLPPSCCTCSVTTRWTTCDEQPSVGRT